MNFIALTIVLLSVLVCLTVLRKRLTKSRLASVGVRLVQYGLMVLVLLTGTMSVIQAAGFGDRFVFVPTKSVARYWNPDRAEFKPEDVYYQSPSGNKIHAWRIKPHLEPGQKPEYYFIYFHGNAGNLTHHYYYNAWLAKNLNAEVFAVDCSGYGESTGSPTEKKCYADALAGLKEFVKLAGIEPSQVIPIGRSLGGAIAMQLAMDMQKAGTPCRAVVLESTFSSIPDMANRAVLGGSALVTTKMDTNSKLQKYTGNVLITHGKRDSVVPFVQALKNYKTATGVEERQGKLAFIVHRLDHMDIPDGYADAIRDFLNGKLEGKVNLPRE